MLVPAAPEVQDAADIEECEMQECTQGEIFYTANIWESWLIVNSWLTRLKSLWSNYTRTF